jgi:hypothetical protein
MPVINLLIRRPLRLGLGLQGGAGAGKNSSAVTNGIIVWAAMRGSNVNQLSAQRTEVSHYHPPARRRWRGDHS